MSSNKYTAEVARGGKDHHRRTMLIRALYKHQGWSNDDFRTAYAKAGSPKGAKYWEWVKEHST